MMKAGEYIKFCKRYAGVPLTSWQLDDLRGVAAHRFSYLCYPSGWGKTLLARCNIAAHFVLSKTRLLSYGAAGDQEQSGILHEGLVELFQHEDLKTLVQETQWTLKLKHHPRSVHRSLPSHAPTTYGLTPSIVTVDELAEATGASERTFFALVAALRKQKDSRLLIITSPGLRGSFAHRLLEDVRNDPRWFVSERTEAETPWLDTDNPDLYATMLPAHIVTAKHKGEWADLEGGVLDREKIEAMETADIPDALGTEARGVDLALSRDQAVVARVTRVEGIFYVVGLYAWVAPRGGRIDLVEIQDEIKAMHRQRPAPTVFDPWQSALMVQQLKKDGVQVKEFIFSTDNRRKLFGRVLDLIETGRLKCRPHPELKKQLLGLSVKKLPSGAWRIDHRPNQKDDLVVGIGLALTALPEVAALGYKPEGLGRRESAFMPTATGPRYEPAIFHPDATGPWSGRRR